MKVRTATAGQIRALGCSFLLVTTADSNTEAREWTETAAWPQSKRFPGLAHGWQGAAWLVFQHERAGRPIPARIGARVVRRLEAELAKPLANGYCGLLIGCAGDAVLAAYAVRCALAEDLLLESACQRLEDVSRHSRQWDVYFGAAGALLGCSEIEAVLRRAAPGALVKRLGIQVLAAMKEIFRPGTAGWYTGMAHGLAGALLAVETAVRRGSIRLPHASRQRYVDVLAGAARRTQNGGILWPQVAEGRDVGLQSWCHGTPGVTLALLALHRVTEDEAYRQLALGGLTAMQLLIDARANDPTLCCGRTGLGHVFLEGFRLTGEERWLAAARRLAGTSRPMFRPHRRGLFKGTLGWTYLQQRLAEPLAYPMPALGAQSGDNSCNRTGSSVPES
jgi:hypothetical protein